MDAFDDILGKYRSTQGIEQLALAVRRLLKIDDQVRPDMRWAIEAELPRRFENFALLPRSRHYLSNDRALTSFDPARIELREDFYLNPDHPVSRYVLAHELGHLMMHHGVLSKPLRDGFQERKLIANLGLEEQADTFARHVLAPRHIVCRFSNITDIIYGCGLIYRLAAQVRRDYGLLPRRKLQPYEIAHLQSEEEKPLHLVR